MATEATYLSYSEAVLVHIELMRYWGESRYGVFDRGLVESALGRARQTAVYSGAGLVEQAATLLYGLVKSHPWVGGNKRTATALTQLFLNRNGYRIVAAATELVELVLAVESGEWRESEIVEWLRPRVKPRTDVS